MAEVIDRETHAVVRTGRGKIVGGVVVLLVLIALATGGYLLWAELTKYESTDDAQIDGDITPVSPRIAGQVVKVHVGDQQDVKTGDVLVELDQSDLKVALARAKADLAEAEGDLQRVRSDVPITSVTTASALNGANAAREDAVAGVRWSQQQLTAARARLATAEANVRVAEANYTKAAQDVERYKLLVEKDEISKQQYDQAAAEAAAAQATLDAQKAVAVEAQQNISVSEMAVEQATAKVSQADASIQSAGTGPQQIQVSEARVSSAAAKVERRKAQLTQAQLNLTYATILAPVGGIVGKKTVQAGQNVSAGQQLMAIVPLEDLWVTANFKETQLRSMKPGQTARIKVDAFGREYTGKVERLAGASGARFSLLPPENATGNYVKVVQRIPVRIALDPGQNGDRILRPGMSVVPSVLILSEPVGVLQDIGTRLKHEEPPVKAREMVSSVSKPTASAADSDPLIGQTASPDSRLQEVQRLLTAGRADTMEGRWDDAIQKLSRAVELNPSSSRAYNARGYAYLLSRKYPQALSDFTTAVRLNPDYENARRNLESAQRAADRLQLVSDRGEGSPSR